MSRYRDPAEVRVTCNYAEAAEWYGFPLPLEPRYDANRNPRQRYFERRPIWLDDVEPEVPLDLSLEIEAFTEFLRERERSDYVESGPGIPYIPWAGGYVTLTD
jgi:hypothetical protein